MAERFEGGYLMKAKIVVALVALASLLLAGGAAWVWR
jgi:hypothetical protein